MYCALVMHLWMKKICETPSDCLHKRHPFFFNRTTAGFWLPELYCFAWTSSYKVYRELWQRYPFHCQWTLHYMTLSLSTATALSLAWILSWQLSALQLAQFSPPIASPLLRPVQPTALSSPFSISRVIQLWWGRRRGHKQKSSRTEKGSANLTWSEMPPQHALAKGWVMNKRTRVFTVPSWQQTQL